MDLYPKKIHFKAYVLMLLAFFITGFILAFLDVKTDSNIECIKRQILNLNYSLDSVFTKIMYKREWDYVKHNRPFQPTTIVTKHHVIADKKEYLITINAIKPISQEWLISSIIVTEIKNSYVFYIDLGNILYTHNFDTIIPTKLMCN